MDGNYFVQLLLCLLFLLAVRRVHACQNECKVYFELNLLIHFRLARSAVASYNIFVVVVAAASSSSGDLYFNAEC